MPVEILPPASGGGLRGLARVTINKKVVAVVFERDGKTAELVRDNCPDEVQSGEWYVRLNKAGDKMFGISPASGTHYFKFLRLPEKQGEVYRPYHVQDTRKKADGQPFSVDYWAWRPVCILTEGKAQGMTFNPELEYRFEPGRADPKLAAFRPGRGKTAILTQQFLTVLGAFDEDIPFTDNVLPDLAKAIGRKGRTALAAFQSGYATVFSPAPETSARRKK